MNKRTYSAQIMVIVLLLLSILSIVALTATLTTVRDSQESVQNKQYQQYYSLGERKILDMQQYLGYTALSALNNNGGNISLPSDIGSTTAGTCTNIEANKYGCDFKNLTSSEIGGGQSQERLDTYVEIEDTNYIYNHSTQKDQDILIPLTSGSNDTYLMWNNQSNLAWSISYDMKDNVHNYHSYKEIYDQGDGPFGGVSNFSADCIDITTSVPVEKVNQIKAAMGIPAESFSHIIKISKSNLNFCNAGVTDLFFRLRPLRSTNTAEITFSLYKDGNDAALQRKITTVTSTSKDYADSQKEDSPTAVLESSYILTYSPLSLFDYVLRTETDIIKN